MVTMASRCLVRVLLHVSQLALLFEANWLPWLQRVKSGYHGCRELKVRVTMVADKDSEVYLALELIAQVTL